MPFDTQTAPVISISAADMLGAMSHLIRAIEKRNRIEVLQSVHMSYADGVLTMRATDLDVEVKATLDAHGDATAWQALVDAATLNKVLAKTKGKADSVILSPLDGGGAVATIGKTRVSLEANATVSDFPVTMAGDFDTCATPVWRKTLADIFTRPAFSISSEETRYYLGGIYLHQPDTANGPRAELRAVATDGHRLAHMECGIELPPMPQGQIVPKKAVDIIGKVLTAKRAPDAARLAFDKTHCQMKCGNIEITAKAIDGTFPDYTRVIPERGATWRMDKTEALDALNASLVMGDSRGCKVKLTLSHDVSEIECYGDKGNASQHFRAEASDATEDCASGFNSIYLGDALKAFKDADEITYSQSNSGNPARFEVSGDPLLVVVMPVRI